MDKDQKRALRAQYEERRPDMGIVCWRSGEQMWIATSKNAATDYNSSLFQLKLGSWPNRAMQQAYAAAPDNFRWSLLKKLDYKERDDDHSEDLQLLYMLCMDEYPQAQPMRPGRK